MFLYSEKLEGAVKISDFTVISDDWQLNEMSFFPTAVRRGSSA